MRKISHSKSDSFGLDSSPSGSFNFSKARGIFTEKGGAQPRLATASSLPVENFLDCKLKSQSQFAIKTRILVMIDEQLVKYPDFNHMHIDAGKSNSWLTNTPTQQNPSRRVPCS
jgi:hypothetical protein